MRDAAGAQLFKWTPATAVGTSLNDSLSQDGPWLVGLEEEGAGRTSRIPKILFHAPLSKGWAVPLGLPSLLADFYKECPVR